MKFDHWKHFRPFFIYPPIALAMLYYALMHNIHSPIKVVFIFLMGLVEWMLIEYLLHRFCFHMQVKSAWLSRLLQGLHLTHHQHTKDIRYIFVPVSFGLALTALSIWLRTLLLWSWQGAIIVTVGIWTGYIWYEFVHYSAHLRRPRSRLLKYLKLYHLKHHFQDEKLWFGVTTPLVDYLFGTYRTITREHKEKIS